MNHVQDGWRLGEMPCLAGFVSPDDAVLSAIVGDDAVHRIAGLPGEPAPVGLTLALGGCGRWA